MLSSGPATPVVLLVDDDDGDAEIANLALKRAKIPHEVLRARNGIEAVDVALERGRDDDPGRRAALILLDLRLPLRSGTEVLKTLRQHEETRFTPIVVVSGSNQPAEIAECYGLGANSFFRKPMDLNAFTENMSLMLFYWLELNAAWGPESEARKSRRTESSGVEAAAQRAVDFTTLHRIKIPGPNPVGSADPPAPILILDKNAKSGTRSAEAISSVTGKAPIMASSMEDAGRKLIASGLCRDRSPWTCPRLVLMDIDHHPVDGPAMLTEIRSMVDHRLPVIFFTTNDEPTFVDRCYRYKPSSIVRKPDASDDYLDTVKLIAHYWLRLNLTVPYGGVP